MDSVEERIHRAARLGVVGRQRLLAVGISDEEILTRVASGSLRRVHPGVYATFGRALDRSHPIPAGVVVHRPNVLRPQDVTTRRGVPITNPLRSLLDGGAVLRPAVVGECVERALVSRLVSVRGLRLILDELGGRGRSGTAALRGHLDRRALGDQRPESVLEPLMARLLLRDLGIGPVEYQRSLVLGGRKLRPDFHIPDALVLVEVDGLTAHSTREALDADLERQNLLVRHGYLVLRYTRTHLRRPARVAHEIVQVSRERIQLLGQLAG